MKEDNISQLGDYDAPFCEQQYTHGSCYISLFEFKSFDQLIPPKLPQILAFTQLWHYSIKSFSTSPAIFSLKWDLCRLFKYNKIALVPFSLPP